MPALLLLLLAVSGLGSAEVLAAHVAPGAGEIRCAIAGLLVGLPVAWAISSGERRWAGARHRLAPYDATSPSRSRWT